MNFLNLLFPQQQKPNLQEAYDKFLESGIEPYKINSVMMAIALDKIESLNSLNANLLEALELAVKQNQHDMLFTREELRQCEAAIYKAKGEQ